jgi:RNA polymerase-binding transcription factor DksA
MDERFLEIADAMNTLLIREGIKVATKKQERPIDFDGFCNCGAEVIEVRLKHGYYNCVDCQTKLERHNKLHRRD